MAKLTPEQEYQILQNTPPEKRDEVRKKLGLIEYRLSATFFICWNLFLITGGILVAAIFLRMKSFHSFWSEILIEREGIIESEVGMTLVLGIIFAFILGFMTRKLRFHFNARGLGLIHLALILISLFATTYYLLIRLI